MKILRVLLFLSVTCAPHAFSAEVKSAPQLAPAFAKAGVTGTFVLLDPESGELTAHDPTRARTRFVPASTFKIANSLIGLDCGAVASVDEILPYGGKPQPFKIWEHDMPLREAIKISAVPIYQELARRVGLQRMQAGVEKLQYGNQTIGEVVDQFWLEGPLEISAVEQVRFLSRVASGRVPAAPEVVASVQEITLLEQTDSLVLHGKTGWLTSSDPKIGWFVGWVEKDGQNYPFALNLDLTDEKLLPVRVELAKECLRILGVLPR